LSIEQTKKIQELEQRISALENMVKDLYAAVHASRPEVLGPAVSSTLTLPKKRANA
jgi:hypothetical protein